MHPQDSHQIRVLVENLVVHDVTVKSRHSVTALTCVHLRPATATGSCRQHSPQSVDHQLLLLLPHPHRQQGPDLPQRCQQINGILHGRSADGVRLLHGTEQLPDAVVLPPQQAEHHPDQLRVLDVRLLGPAGDGLGNELFQVG